MKKYILSMLAAGIILTALFDLFLLRECRQSYADAKYAIAAIAKTKETGPSAVRWLKEFPDASAQALGKELLAFYGYDAKTPTIWDTQYKTTRNKILAASAAFDLLLLFVPLSVLLFYEKQRSKQLLALEQTLGRLQDADATEADVPIPVCDDRLYDRIHSLKEQLLGARGQMEQEQERTKALITDISHQLKTPVSALKTSLELLLEEPLTPEERLDFSRRCMRQVAGLENLTKALVNVSRMEKGMITLHVKPAGIQQTLRSSVSRLYVIAARKQIAIELSEDSLEEDLPVLHDAKWTEEVFVNLLENAIKYSGAHTTISIRTRRLVQNLRIDVTDEGAGIPKSEYHKIFQRFYRGAHAADTEGSGVGLYLARELIERQNGILYVHSRTDGKTGSVFSVQLPLA